MSEGAGNEILREAIAADKAGDRPTARLLLALATEADPRNDLAWMWRASVCENPTESIPFLENALGINPSNEMANEALRAAVLNAGVAAAQAGNKETARGFLSRVCELAPDNEVAWMWRAGVTDAPAEALSYLEKVLEINPANEKAKTAAEFYRAKLKAVPEWYCPICQTKSTKKFVTCPECRCVLSLADSTDAVNNFKSDEAKILQGISRLQAKLGEKAEFTTHYYLGMALLNLQRFPEAIRHFHEAGKLNPDNAFFGQHLKALEKRLDGRSKKAKTETPVPSSRNTPIETMVKPASAEPPKKCVLVADGSSTMLRLINFTLTRAGYRIIEATDGNDVAEILNGTDIPDAAILDVDLPGADGYSTCKLIRSKAETEDIPIVLLSEKDEIFDKKRGKMAGMTVSLSKPFQPDALVRLILEFCPT